jgi:acyl-CoA thioester hydrolase
MTPEAKGSMPDFHFYHPIEVRYGDLDPQGHVNNAAYLTYMEQARLKYYERLGLFQGHDFLALGVILAEATCTYLAPILYGTSVHVGVRTVRLGNKSFQMEYAIQDQGSGAALASGKTTQVAYDYRARKSIPLPDSWRKILNEFEGLIPAG